LAPVGAELPVAEPDRAIHKPSTRHRQTGVTSGQRRIAETGFEQARRENLLVGESRRSGLQGGGRGFKSLRAHQERPSRRFWPVKSGLRVRRVGLCPCGGVHSVQRSVQREDGLFGDAEDGV